MHYEDIQLKQSTYAIISFNERAGAEPPRARLAVWDPPGASHRAGGRGGGTTQDVYIHFALSLIHCTAWTRLSHFSSVESISQMCTTVSCNYIRGPVAVSHDVRAERSGW